MDVFLGVGDIVLLLYFVLVLLFSKLSSFL